MKVGVDEFRKYSALIRATFHIDPSKLSDDEFAKLAAEALFIKDFDRQTMETALVKVVSALFPKQV